MGADGLDEIGAPLGEGSMVNFYLSIRYGLPCQYWLFAYGQIVIPIPIIYH